MTYESSAAAKRRAFTLLELIISLVIIAILLTLVIAPLHRIQNSANRTDSLGALRQMALAYASYSADHRQRLMPGYIDEDLLNQLNITAKLPDGTSLADSANCDAGICDASAYVWRLAPYLDHAWETMFVDYHDNQLRSRLDQEFRCGIVGPGTASEPCDLADAPLLIADIPSFGMNSIFVGGDSFHGGPAVTSHNPWTGTENKIAATRLSEVKNPGRLIVFGATARARSGLSPGSGPGADETYDSEERLGYVELHPPFTVFNGSVWTDRQWEVGKNLEIVRTLNYSGPTGLPVARWGANLLPIAHLDGSTAVEEASTLSFDMRRWSPFAFGLLPPPMDLP